MKKKKGFTLVELLVVIAILAILAAVSVVGYLSFTNKAKESNDISLTTQMNTVLQANEVQEKPDSLGEVISQIKEDGGIDLEVITPNSKGYNYAWDKATNRILLLDGTSVVAPEDAKDSNTLDTIIIVHNEKELNDALTNNYGIALSSLYNDTVIDSLEKMVSVDNYAGKINKLTIRQNSKSVSNNVYFAGKYEELSISSTNSIDVYGEVIKLNLNDSKETNIYANVTNVTITSGNINIKDKAVIDYIDASNATDKVVINKTSNAKLGAVQAPEGNKDIIEGNVNNVVVDTKPNENFSGLGTKNSPYLITNSDEFLKICTLSEEMKNCKEYHFKLVNNIDLREVEFSANMVSPYFNGSLDGNNKNLISNDSLDYIFGNNIENVLIKDLNFILLTKRVLINSGFENENRIINVTLDNVDITTLNEDTIINVINNEGFYFDWIGNNNVDSTSKWSNLPTKNVIIKNCDFDLNINGSNYNAVFIGGGNYNDKTESTCLIENCTYEGKYYSEKPNLVLGNVSGLDSVKSFTIRNVKNNGEIYGVVRIPLIAGGASDSEPTSDNYICENVSLNNVKLLTDNKLNIENSDKGLQITKAESSNVSKYVISFVGEKRLIINTKSENSSYNFRIELNPTWDNDKFITGLKFGKTCTDKQFYELVDTNRTVNLDPSKAYNLLDETTAKVWFVEFNNLPYYVFDFENDEIEFGYGKYFEDQFKSEPTKINTAKIQIFDNNGNLAASKSIDCKDEYYNNYPKYSKN